MSHLKAVENIPIKTLLTTSNILFIAGGAFDGIERIINKRLNMSSVGFKNSQLLSKHNSKHIISNIIPNDLKFGLIPKFRKTSYSNIHVGA